METNSNLSCISTNRSLPGSDLQNFGMHSNRYVKKTLFKKDEPAHTFLRFLTFLEESVVLVVRAL